MHVHASITVFVSRSGSAGNLPPVSTREAFAARCTPEGCIVPLGFCFGGFSSTAGYVPGNEARRGSEEPASDLHLQDDQSIQPSNRFYPFDSVLPEGKT